MKTKLILIFAATMAMTAFAARLSLDSWDKYIFTELRDTNSIYGVGIGTNCQNSTKLYPLRLEDWTYCYEAAEERKQTAYANLSYDYDDGRLPLNRPDRRMSFIPNVSDYIHIYNSIYAPLADTNAPFLLSDAHIGLARSTLHAVTNDYGVTIATNDGWLGYHNFFEYPTFLTNSNGFRRVISAHNFQEYLYYNLEAAKGMRFLRRGYAGTHSNKIANAYLTNIYWTYDDNNGWTRHEPAPQEDVSWSSQSAGMINSETYRYYRQLRKSTMEAWRYDPQSKEHVYQGSRNGVLDYVWRMDEINNSVTNYLSITNDQGIVGITHAGIVVDYIHTRTIQDCDNGETNKVFGSGKYYVAMSPTDFTISGKLISITINYDTIAKQVLDHIGQEVHPSMAGPIMTDEIAYPRALQNRNVEIRYNHVIDDLKMKIVAFSGIVRMKWNSRQLHDD